jgi:hypothetical protein
MPERERFGKEAFFKVPVEAVEAVWAGFPEQMQHLAGALAVVNETKPVSFFTDLVNAELSQPYRQKKTIEDADTALFMATLRQAEVEYGVQLLQGPTGQVDNVLTIQRDADYRLHFQAQAYIQRQLPALYQLYFIRYRSERFQEPVIELLEGMPEASLRPPQLVPKGLSIKFLWQKAADEIR